MSKQPSKDPDYSSSREFTVVLEDLRSQFRTFGEGLEDVQHRLEKLEDITGQLKEDMGLIKIAVPQIFSRLDIHERRFTALESPHE